MEANLGYHSQAARRIEKGCPPAMLVDLTSQEAFQLAAAYARTADRMRAAHGASEIRLQICETASRIAFLRAHRIAEREELFPSLGDTFERVIFVFT